MDEKAFVDDWHNHYSDKTLYVQNWSGSEYKVTYRNGEGKKFSVIFRPKKYPIGFHVKY